MIKLLIGGSPCTHWSIAQTKSRETKPEGLGWELFQNFLIALRKFQPDYFLYENNKSMSNAIRKQISEEFGLEPVLINSARVSAQNRQRLYWIGRRNANGTYDQVPIEQPKDLGLLVRDILDENPTAYDISNYKFITGETTESGNINFLGGFAGDGKSKWLEDGKVYSRNFSQGKRLHSIDGKSITVTAQAAGLAGHAGLYAVPYNNCPSKDSPHRVCNINGGRQGDRIYSTEAKSCAIKAQGGGLGGHGQGLYAIPASQQEQFVYEVRDSKIIISGKGYPIRLPDGFYILHKLSVRECMRLQTVPKDYIFPVSDSQAYKMLGNGWTCDVITHILSQCPGIAEEPLTVLSMYDGMSCGRIALNKLGADVTRYYATEIDKYAIETTQHNFPDTIQLSDAFSVRKSNWMAE